MLVRQEMDAKTSMFLEACLGDVPFHYMHETRFLYRSIVSNYVGSMHKVGLRSLDARRFKLLAFCLWMMVTTTDQLSAMCNIASVGQLLADDSIDDDPLEWAFVEDVYQRILRHARKRKSR